MAETYKKHTHREHILELPDTYIGSIETTEESRWIFDASEGKMVHRKVQFNPGLYKTFDELIVNARDALVRSQGDTSRIPVKRIDISVGDVNEKYTITVKNDGDGIPIQKHETEKCWIPELIFGHLLTSSNYNKDEEKIVGGKNGYGSKLCSVFATDFKISIRDPKSQQRYEQTWKNNMSICEKPNIQKDKATKGYVEVIYVPDLTRFKDVHKDDMTLALHTRVVELAALVGKDVKVTWNGEEIKSDTFEKFVRLFLRADSEKMLAYEQCGPRWEVAAVLTRSLFSDETGTPEDRHISFVNGINTRKGGKHVETVQRHVLSDICEVATKKKKLDLKPGQIKDTITFFVNATIVNPAFDSQTKETLTTPANKFGSTVNISPKFTDSLVKAGVLEEAQAIMDAKLARDSKKTDGAKKRTIYGLPKLEDALCAGTAKSSECTLILTEGDSAATSAIAGLKIVGRERWGVFPLKGKLLNVKDISRDKFNGNEELSAIKKILGLEQGKDYKDTTSLRYGRILIMSDQDVDGFHIRGLLMNLFHTEWPQLMKLGFLCSLMTPLVKMTRGNEVLSFYSDAELENWRESVGADVAARYKSKYYKGLGTSTPAEAREWFENLSDIRYEWDENTDHTMNLAFSKKQSDERKTWLATYDPKKSIQFDVDTSGKKKIPYSRFVNDELIHFSNADNLRSLPHIMDGLKPSQRKILFGCFKRNLKSEVRVAQLAGYVSEHAAYHHGEASLNQTITSMAQIFVGANNINLLAPIGQFGCLAPETPILMWNGEIKTAEEVVIGDELVGDDGLPRTVLKTTNGIDDMYKVIDYKGNELIVNSQHILTLYYKQNFSILWKESHQAWNFNYFDGKTIKTVSLSTNNLINENDHFNKSKINKMDGFIIISKKCDELKKQYNSSNIIDIKIDDYLKLAAYHKRKLYMVSNTSCIEWEKQDVPIDPYILGAWLGDGDHYGKGFTTADEEIIKKFVFWGKTIDAEITHHNNKNHDGYHYCIRRKGTGHLPAIGSKDSNKNTCIGCLSSNVEIKHDTCSWKCDEQLDNSNINNIELIAKCQKYRLNPFTQLLRDNNLYMNKHIPINYIINDKETRLKLLAGFIDTDGTVKDNNSSNAFIEISQSKRLHENLIRSLEFIAKSLGYATSIYHHSINHRTSKGDDMSLLTLRIMGTNLNEIPTILKRKQINYSSERIKRTNHYTKFEVSFIGKDRFCGWQVDKNERFLLGNFIVTHNSRLLGGKDSASPRYIHTHLEAIVDKIFKKEDAPILKNLEDDGDIVEPDTYYPVVPLLAINGSVGIGTGFSTDIPPHNPREIVDLLRSRIKGEVENISGKTLNPWWVGFKGSVEQKEDKQWITKAVYKWNDEICSVHITELPIGVWTKDYKVYLDTMIQGDGPDIKAEEKATKKTKKSDDTSSTTSDKKKSKPKSILKGFEDLYNDVDVNFILYLDSDYYKKAKQNPADFEKLFHLTSSWKTTNMCCFDPQMCIKKYDTIGDILEQFFAYRLVAYEDRRQHQIADMKDHLEEVEAKLNFVKAIVENRLKIVNEEDDVVLKGLMGLGLPPRSDREAPETLGAYEYLLKMRVDRIKKKSVEESENEVIAIKKKLVDLESKTATTIWLEELDEFIEEWDKTEKNILHILSASAEKVPNDKRKLNPKRLKK